MIFVHTYKIGTNENKKERRALWDSQEEAIAQQRVLGGVVQAFVPVEDIDSRAHVAASEISEKFDDIASRQLHISEPLMHHKRELMSKVRKIVRGEFDSETGLWK